MVKTKVVKKSKRSKPEASVIKASVPLPPEVHRALQMASIDTGTSNTKLILAVVEERFKNGQHSPLRLLAPNGDAEAWKRVSVFLPSTLKVRAAHEVQRQHGNPEDKRFSGSLASAIAALVAEKYLPDFTF